MTYADFLQVVAEIGHTPVRTVAGRTDFYVEKSRTGVRFIVGLGSTISVHARKIQEYLDIFNATQSFTTTHYNQGRFESVYVLGIIKLWWEKQQAQKATVEAVMAETAGMDLNLELDEAEEFSAAEGAWRVRLHVYRERDGELVRRAKEAFRLKHGGRLFCEVCGFDFGKVYGEPDFIEAHHRVPLRDLEAGTRTKISDLAMVCANCHRMLHRGKQWPDVEDLKKRLKLSPSL